MVYLKDNLLEICTLLVSLFAIFMAFRSNQISKTALNIYEKEFENKQSNFGLYLIDNLAFNIDSKRYFLFHITISNKSHLPNSFEAELNMIVKHKKNVWNKYKLKHLPNVNIKIKEKYSLFNEIIKLSEKDKMSNWLLFEIPKNIEDEKKIDVISINLIDIEGQVSSIRSTVIKETEL